MSPAPRSRVIRCPHWVPTGAPTLAKPSAKDKNTLRKTSRKICERSLCMSRPPRYDLYDLENVEKRCVFQHLSLKALKNIVFFNIWAWNCWKALCFSTFVLESVEKHCVFQHLSLNLFEKSGFRRNPQKSHKTCLRKISAKDPIFRAKDERRICLL